MAEVSEEQFVIGRLGTYGAAAFGTANPDRPAYDGKNRMVQRFLIAAGFSILPAIALAQSNPHFIGEGDNPHVAYDAPTPNIVGSALATVSGPSDQTQYETQRVVRTQVAPVRYDYGRRQNWQLPVTSKS